MTHYPTLQQFINYEAGTKRPVSTHGLPINPHDPSVWMDEATARAASERVGFVLTDSDPYFLLDIDKQKDPVTGEWSELANRLVTVFSGAGVEVSQSGTGLHIIGRCDQRALQDRRNKWDGCLEFYTQGRYIALGPHGLRGDVDMDCTALLLDTVPVRDAGAGVALSDGPAPDWNGPTDDDELIKRMIATRGSVAAQFGDKATVAQLWEADTEALARFFPAYGADDPYDRSSADAALMSHLAFWTGRDGVRMDRLFRRSALMRDKYERRRDYREATVGSAASGCVNVYSDPRGLVPAAADGTVLPAAVRPEGEIMSLDQMYDYFDGYVYVESLHKMMTPEGFMLKPEQFNGRMGGFEFIMSGDGSRPTRNAFEAFTQNRAAVFTKVHGVRNTPFEPFGAIRDGMVNVFKMPVVAVSNDPVDKYLDLLSRVIPDERDRRIYLSWCAAMCQSPGHKFQWSLVLQGTKGNGKTLLMKFLEQAVGETVSHLPNPDDMDEKYNGYMRDSLFVGVEEIHMAGRRSLMDRLKIYITGERVEIREMGVDKYMATNLTNWMFLTNYKDAILKDRSDRRYAIFFTAQQDVTHLDRDGMGGTYFPELWHWARNGGYAAVAGYLRRYDVDPEFDPRYACHRAPETTSTDEAVEESLGALEQEILEAIGSELPGFKGGWVSSVRLREHLDRRNFRSISPRVMRGALDNIGYRPCKLWKDGRANPIIQEYGMRPTLYCTDNINNSAIIIDNYLNAQNYSIS